MSKRRARPLFEQDGFLFRLVKTLADGTDLLYCDKRQTIGCTASARRINGQIIPRSEHIGHEADNEVASAKIARHTIKEIAASTTCTPKELLNEVQASLPLHLAGSRDSLTKMIYRARAPRPEPRVSTLAMETDTDADTFYNTYQNSPSNTSIQEALMNLVKEEMEEVPEIEHKEEKEVSALQNQMVTVPVDNYFERLQSIVREAIKESNEEMIAEIKTVVGTVTKSAGPSESSQEITKNLNDDIKTFLTSLTNLASHLESGDLKQRTEAVLNKFANNKLEASLEDILDATLNSLENLSNLLSLSIDEVTVWSDNPSAAIDTTALNASETEAALPTVGSAPPIREVRLLDCGAASDPDAPILIRKLTSNRTIIFFINPSTKRLDTGEKNMKMV
ncbi:hypothetical protein GCK72_009504 [Caenorhabditis remanei]|uniref:FLYWCH-type domain-containing protein n=1 Tax=Caenorhabditis remanei TaxID=31234 RepID=A0A6A5H0D2_CAERE|nr:hypothetical protein GCK72_009504 [Caenorhabditis remanei]KAF1761250.1 hypothetical protein GCK72_009504 [Caenorhabditis remanei]